MPEVSEAGGGGGRRGGKKVWRSVGHRILPQGSAAGHRARAEFQHFQEEATLDVDAQEQNH